MWTSANYVVEVKGQWGRFVKKTRWSHLEAQSLEGSDGLSELAPLVGVGNSSIESTLSKSNHLSSNSDPSLVENINRNLVSLADLSDNVSSRDTNVVKVDGVGGRGTDSELRSGNGRTLAVVSN